MSSTKFIIGMRDAFFEALYKLFVQDKDAVMLVADNGAPSLDQFWENLDGQYFNVGISEQLMIGMACGMALEGKKVYTYAIAPFATLRCFEQIKVDMCAMNMPIVDLGVGSGYAYDTSGPTHHACEDVAIMRTLPNLTIYSPADAVTAAALAEVAHHSAGPHYIRFDRIGIPDLYVGRDIDFDQGFILTREGHDIGIIANGIMVHQALKIADRLEEVGISTRVVDLFRLKPINAEALLQDLSDLSGVVTLEEQRLPGAMGSAIAEIFVDSGITQPLLRIGDRDRFVFEMGGRQTIWEQAGLDVDAVVRRITGWKRRDA